MTKLDAIRELIEQVRPDVLHTYYLDQLKTVGPLAERMGLPFTIRAHSFDVLSLHWGRPSKKENERLHYARLTDVREGFQPLRAGVTVSTSSNL